MIQYVLFKKIPLAKGEFFIRYLEHLKSGVVFTSAEKEKAKKFDTKEKAENFIKENNLTDWEVEEI